MVTYLFKGLKPLFGLGILGQNLSWAKEHKVEDICFQTRRGDMGDILGYCWGPTFWGLTQKMGPKGGINLG